MKKFIVIVIVIGLAGGGVYKLSQMKFRIGLTEGKTDKVTRGDLVIPITATGSIEPASITNIKSQASGEVVNLPFQLGEMVKKGDLVVELDEDDEQRSVERAEADVARAEVAKAKALLAKEEKEKVAIPLTKAKVAQAEAVHDRIVEYMKKLKSISETGVDKFELFEQETKIKEAKAALDAAEAEARQAEIALRLADEDIKSAEEAHKTALKSLEDAEERLSETKIVAPSDGMVLSRHIQFGEIVQSGMNMFGGGTLLMQLADVSDIYAVVNVDEADIGRVRELAPPEARPGYTHSKADEEEPAAAATQPAGSDSDAEPFHVDKSQQVEVTVESFEDEKFFGVIERISPQAELVRAIATFRVWIRITSDNRDKLIGQMNTQAEAKFTVNAVEDAVLVNWEAMRPNPDGEGYGVFVPVKDPATGQEEPEFREVEFGVSDGIRIEVIEGLKEDDKVYIELPIKTAKQAREEREAEKK